MGLKKSFFVIFIALIMASCAESKSKGPNSTGRGSEIIVVCSKKLWNGPIGDTIRGVLTRSMEGLPEAELCILHGGGHMVNLEQPAGFNDAVLEFLAGL